MSKKNKEVSSIKEVIEDSMTIADYQLTELRELEKKNKELVMKLGDIEVQRALITKEVLNLDDMYKEFEKKIINEFGKGALIDINTGKVSYSKHSPNHVL